MIAAADLQFSGYVIAVEDNMERTSTNSKPCRHMSIGLSKSVVLPEKKRH
jgi:hypothetical protein